MNQKVVAELVSLLCMLIRRYVEGVDEQKRALAAMDERHERREKEIERLREQRNASDAKVRAFHNDPLRKEDIEDVLESVRKQEDPEINTSHGYRAVATLLNVRLRKKL